MKNRSIIAVLIILTLASPLLSEEIEKNIILNSMTFPSPDIKIGSALNDPFFAINIESEKINTAEITGQILSAEKELNDKTVPEKNYQLGNFYKNINNYKNAVKYYKKYLELTASTDIISMEESGKLLVKGEIYYSLSVIDLKKNRADNLEKSLLFFTKAVELNPDNRSIWVKLGDCYLAAGKTTEALYCYNKVLEKNSKDFQIYSRLQAATFQRDYLKLSESKIEDRIEIQPVTQGFDFDYLETSINNSPDEFKEGLKLQHYIYLLRLMLINNNNFQFKSNPGIIKDEETILNEADKLLKSVRKENLNKLKLKYLSGIVNYLKKDYKKSISDFKEILSDNENPEFVYDDILFINSKFIKENMEIKKATEDIIKVKPDPKYYLLLAGLEFENKNFSKAEMLCAQSLKIDKNYAEAYSAVAVISAIKGNYIAADEMIKKGNSIIKKNNSGKQLYNDMKVNEAAIALLKNEKERAYILLRSVISVDNNEKAYQLYNRYYIKK